MADSEGGRSISERCSDVRWNLLHALEKSTTAESPVEVGKIEDALDRFKLWTGNLGALHAAYKRISLESRLADSPEVKDQIREHLDDLQEASQDLLSLLSESRSGLGVNKKHARDAAVTNAPANDLTLDTLSEHTTTSEKADSILGMISECLRALFRIGILVRKATPRDRFERALQQSEYAFTAQFDINYIEEKYPKLALEISGWLTRRLGNANSKRRQFINYARDHRAKLQVEDSNAVMNAPTVRQSSKATTFVAPVNLTTPEFLESSLGDDDDSASLVSASTAFDTETSLRLPSLADLGPDGEYFECPICFTLQSFRREKAWKVHAYADLKAYICTSAGQGCEHKMFKDRDTWFDHELKQHLSLYVCKFCGDQCETLEILQQHLANEHGSNSGEEIKSVIEHGRLVPPQLKAQDCPFCDEWASILSRRRHQTDGRAPPLVEDEFILVSLTHFKRHVATHQEQLAIFAMPRIADSDDDRSKDAGDSNSEACSSQDGSPQHHNIDDLNILLETLDEDFKANMTNLCDVLLTNPPSDPQTWKSQYMNIITMVSWEIERKRAANEASDLDYNVLEYSENMQQAARVLLNICPSFAALMDKSFTLPTPGDEMGHGQHPTVYRFRVKIYKFVNDGWEDQGTGFCVAFGIYDNEEKRAYIDVSSEWPPNRSIIRESVQENSNFQQSGEDMIVWSDSQTDITMALSFQETTGRDQVWKIIDSVQQSVEKESVQPVIYDEVGQLHAAASRVEEETEADPSEAADLFRELAFGEEQDSRQTTTKALKRSIAGKIPCPNCTGSFVHRRELERHMLTHNNKQRPSHMCVLCRATFTRRDNLKRHHQRCRNRQEIPTSASHQGGREDLTQGKYKNVDSGPDATTAIAPGRAGRLAILNKSRDLSDMNEENLNKPESNMEGSTTPVPE